MAKQRSGEFSLDDALDAVNKTGRTNIKLLGDAPAENVDRISSGNFALDQALGGGFPCGKIVELYGNWGSGKSSLSLLLIAEAQAVGKRCVYVDTENAFNRQMAVQCGVDVDALAFTQPGSTEATFDIVEAVLPAKDVGVIVVDSVAAMTPEAEINGDYGDATVGLMARLMGQGMRKLNSQMIKHDSQTILVFINQIRSTIGSIGYGPQTTTTGGRSLPFYASVRCEVAKLKQIKRGDDIVGHEMKVKVVKNRFGSPQKQATFDMMYETGISNGSGLLDLCVDVGVVLKSGNWYVVASTGEKLGNGRPASVEKLDGSPELTKMLEDEFLAVTARG